MKTLTSRSLPVLSAALLLSLTACSDPDASATSASETATPPAGATGSVAYNTSPEQDRIRTEEDPALAAKVPEQISEDGRLTVATTAGSIPLTFHADDDTTVIGSEIDLAQLVADKVGLELDIQVTSWENWPLKTRSGDYEVVFSNVGVNDERLELFDFASYRAAFMGFEARTDSDLVVEDFEDISGKTVSVGSGTNQEKILLAWNEQLQKEGKDPASLQYYANDADTVLALASGRLDLNLGPYPTAVYRENTRDDLKVVGKINAGWPSETLVAATTLKDNGLAPVLTDALNATIDDGTYRQVLERWGLEEEAVPAAELITEDSR